MSLWAVLATGLFAGGASCAAVQGGLLAGVVARRRPERRSGSSGADQDPGGKPEAAAPSPPLEDAVPVATFLGGKLLSHAVLGAALGLAGDAVQVGPRVRAYMLITAGMIMVLLALDLLGVAAVRRFVPAPPAAWSRLVRRSGRWRSGLAPGLLGVATVLIPCGVTLSMMFLAVASGSPLAGAAIMATFVLGTIPLFAAIGYAARRSAAVLVAGLVAVNTGLVLNGSSFTLAGAVRGVTGSDRSPSVSAPEVAADGVQRIVIQAHDTGYSPSAVTARAGVPTELSIRTDNTRGCTRAIVMSSVGVEKMLPVTGDTRIDLGTLDPGTYRYSCSMGMYGGSIKVVA
jgi:uncharacterized protein